MPDNITLTRNTAGHDSTRERIVAAARRHFFAFGFRGVTMDDLARELGMSKKTLYVYFPGKVALVQAAVLDKQREIEADLKRITSDSSLDFVTVLREVLERQGRHLEEIRPPFVRDLQRDLPHVFGLAEARRRDVVRRYFGKILDAGRRDGIVRKDIPEEVAIEMLLAAVQAIMNPDKLTELGLTLKTGFSAIVTVIMEGVITEAGRSKL